MICWRVFPDVGPIGNMVPGHIHPRHQANPGWRANRIGIAVGKLHATAGKLFHVRRVVFFIEFRNHFIKWEGTILPAHVVHHEKDDVGLLMLCVNKKGSRQQNQKKYS
jgi:hypothetical protein